MSETKEIFLALCYALILVFFLRLFIQETFLISIRKIKQATKNNIKTFFLENNKLLIYYFLPFL
jgi:hypothetical protein